MSILKQTKEENFDYSKFNNLEFFESFLKECKANDNITEGRLTLVKIYDNYDLTKDHVSVILKYIPYFLEITDNGKHFLSSTNIQDVEVFKFLVENTSTKVLKQYQEELKKYCAMYGEPRRNTIKDVINLREGAKMLKDLENKSSNDPKEAVIFFAELVKDAQEEVDLAEKDLNNKKQNLKELSESLEKAKTFCKPMSKELEVEIFENVKYMNEKVFEMNAQENEYKEKSELAKIAREKLEIITTGLKCLVERDDVDLEVIAEATELLKESTKILQKAEEEEKYSNNKLESLFLIVEEALKKVTEATEKLKGNRLCN